tara:strand:- start:19684 stop:20058 length:375 start_codon:yes stop_codon:yes gene_type:complete
MTTTPTDGSSSGIFDLDLTIECACDLLYIDTTDVIGVQRLKPSAKLALATIAEIALRRGGMSIDRLAIELKLPRTKIANAMEKSDDGMLDTVAASHEYATTIEFLGACLAKLNSRMGYPEEPER